MPVVVLGTLWDKSTEGKEPLSGVTIVFSPAAVAVPPHLHAQEPESALNQPEG